VPLTYSDTTGGLRSLPSAVEPELSRIPCAVSTSVKLVPVCEVEYVKSTLAGVYVVTPQGEFYTELTLSSLETRAHLVRCHKQYLVNFDRIDEIDLARDSLAIRTRWGATVPLSRRYLARLRQLLGLGRVRPPSPPAIQLPAHRTRRRMLAPVA
jgi:two-component system LytT family response regulator